MLEWPVSDVAAELHRTAVVWEQHACLPLKAQASIEPVRRYRRAGANLVTLNVGFGQVGVGDAVTVLASFRQQVLAAPESYLLVDRAEDVVVAAEDGRLAVSFDLEGVDALGGELAMIEAFHHLGVRTMLIAYNQPNAAGGGCHGDPGDGLTDYGRAVVREMNRVGMMVDASHCSVQTTYDLFDVSSAPVIFSHSNPRALFDHPRNISDEQIRACAATGGVIGINGIGAFLGNNDTRTETIVRAIMYVSDLVGVDHVGLGLDFVFDKSDLAEEFASAETFPEGFGYGTDNFDFVEPERLPAITEALLAEGLDERSVRAVLGENFLRVARLAWG
jgi:membrane dipeptidase